MDMVIGVFGGLFLALLCACVYTKYRGIIRKKTEEITGIKMVRNNVYQGVLDDQTYEGMIIELFNPVSLMAIFLYFPLKGKGIYWGFVVSWLYPAVMELLRIKTFGERNILPQTGVGYHPVYIYFMAVFAGIGFLLGGFGILNFHNPSISSILFILIGIGMQTIFMFPDYINRIVPFEIRSPKGHLFLAVLLIFMIFFVDIPIVWLLFPK